MVGTCILAGLLAALALGGFAAIWRLVDRVVYRLQARRRWDAHFAAQERGKGTNTQ